MRRAGCVPSGTAAEPKRRLPGKRSSTGGARQRTARLGRAAAVHGRLGVFLGYELASEIEPRLRAAAAAPLPWQAFALRTPCALIHERDGSIACWRLLKPRRRTRSTAWRAMRRPPRAQAPEPSEQCLPVASLSEEPAQAYPRARAAGEGIHPRRRHLPGESVASLAYRSLPQAPAVAALYRRLCAANPAPFAALAQWQDVAILSSSPERLRAHHRRRDSNTADRRHAAAQRRCPAGTSRETAELAAHPKERAEHVMLIDLERNDLGRVCEAGTRARG